MSVVNNLSSIKRFEDPAIKGTGTSGKAASTTSGMGQQDFLKLFTTQLQNQNPLDPTKNEAFVAQLAQFSQLEATTNMASQLTSFVSSQAGDRMLSGAALIGKKVAMAGAPAVVSGGQPVQGLIDLPNGAQGMRLEIFDSRGVMVRQQIAGAQAPGEVTLTWDGRDSAGTQVPDGAYTFKATVTTGGVTQEQAVKTLATVRSISQADAASELMLQVDGGRQVKLSEVQRLGG